MWVQGRASLPAREDLFDIGDSPLLCCDKRERFLSMVAKLLHLAKRVRPDLLVSLSLLATRVLHATERDDEVDNMRQ